MTTPPFQIPKIFGILNITPDSFSDGGRYLDPQKALNHAIQLNQDGADVIDIGAVSSHPDAQKVDAAEELARLQIVVDECKKQSLKLSIDSFNPTVQKEVLKWDIDFINDINGFAEPIIYEFLQQSNCKLVLMHCIQGSGKADRQFYKSDLIVAEIQKFFESRLSDLIKANIAKKRIILDPGMGFFLGSNPEMSFAVLKNLHTIKSSFENEVMVSVSRKSFLGSIANSDVHSREFLSLTAELWAAMQGADWIRTHDPAKLKSSLKMWAKLAHSP